MNADEFYDWADMHCTLLGINFPDDRATVGAWLNPFADFGYTIAELKAATGALVALNSHVRLSEQLAWINDFIRRLRRRSGPPKRREPDAEHKFDQANYRKEIERLFPGHRWTTPAVKKRKAKAS